MNIRKIEIFLIFIYVFLSLQSTQAQSKPYLILISFDGFRWDYAERGVTPNLDKIKSSGVSALSLRPSFPSKTFPNHQSIITGMYPEHHGIIHNDFTNPFTNERYKMSDSQAVSDGKWYLGEAFWETAERQGIKTASYFWPGSEVKLSYRRPSYVEHYDQNRSYSARIEGVMNWFKMPYAERPHFITLYFEATDTKGHKYGVNAPETKQAIQQLDSVAGRVLSRLKEIDMLDSTDVIILSDHGMTDISNKRLINIEEITGPGCKIDGQGPVMMIEPAKQKTDQIFKLLQQKENHYKVYMKNEVPEYYKFNDNPFIYSIVVVADMGWSLVDNKSIKWASKNEIGGNHGFDNNNIDMHGIFFATGPSFKHGYKTGTLWNVDIYPLLCKIFGVSPRVNIDGKLERIGFLLLK